MTRIELLGKDAVPGGSAGIGRPRHTANQRCIGQTRQGPRLHAGSTDIRNRYLPEQLTKAINLLVQQAENRFRRAVTRGKAGASGDQHNLHPVFGDPVGNLRTNAIDVVLQQHTLGKPVSSSKKLLDKQLARGVGIQRACIADGQNGNIERDKRLLGKVTHKRLPVVGLRCGVLYHRLLPEHLMPQHLLADCSILLLAGGRGQRMGGHDKGLVEWHGKPLVAWAQRVARPLTDDLLISCNRNPERYAPFADQLVSDDEPDFPGPLAGIRAGLAAARHRWMMVLPCDAPLIDEALLLQLHGIAREIPDTPVMARRGTQWEPLFCVIPLSIAGAIEAAWQAGERSNRRILVELGARSLELPEDDPRLANLNAPELLARHTPPMGT